MATANWTGGGTWGGAGNDATWTGGSGTAGAPAAGDDVVLNRNGNHTLTLGANTPSIKSFTISSNGTGDTLAVSTFALNVNSAGSTGITLSQGKITIAGGTINDTSGVALASGTSISGHGALNVTGSYTGTGTLTASGGILDVFGTVASGVVMTIGTTAGSDLKIEGTATSAAPITINNVNQTLEVGASGALTINGGAESITNGAIKMDGGTLTDSGGLTIGSTAKLSGIGAISASTAVSGSGTIEATGSGTLDIKGSLTSTAALQVDTGSTLELDGTSSATSLTFLHTGGTLDIGPSGSLTLTTALNAASNAITLNGGTLTDTAGVTIGSSGSLSGFGVIGAGTAVGGTGTVTASGGTLEFKGAVDSSTLTSLSIANGGDLKFDAAVGSGANAPTVTFAGNNGTLDLSGESSLSNFDAKIAGFRSGDSLNLGAGFVGDTVTLANGGKTLDIFNGATLVGTINLTTSYTGSSFTIGAGGALTTNAACFMAGTRIATPDGEVAVETLKRGDVVLTADGRAMPIAWLGVQTISATFADPNRVWPIRVKAGALVDNVPARDLLLSPDHALLVEGVLIQAGALVNGTSITRELRVPKTFVYYHVELADHSLILAEGAPAETFVDNVDRLGFDNWAEHQALYPEGKEIEELPYPRAKALRQIPVDVRVKLAERAQAIGAKIAQVA